MILILFLMSWIMQVKIDKSFQKDVKKIKEKNNLKRIATTIRHIQRVENISDIKNLKKLAVSNNNYRIRIGDYRIGLIITEDTIEFVRFLHRKDIYKYFPK